MPTILTLNKETASEIVEKLEATIVGRLFSIELTPEGGETQRTSVTTSPFVFSDEMNGGSAIFIQIKAFQTSMVFEEHEGTTFEFTPEVVTIKQACSDPCRMPFTTRVVNTTPIGEELGNLDNHPF